LIEERKGRAGRRKEGIRRIAPAGIKKEKSAFSEKGKEIHAYGPDDSKKNGGGGKEGRGSLPSLGKKGRSPDAHSRGNKEKKRIPSRP